MKGQASMEFLIFVCIGMFFLLISVVFYADRIFEVSEFQIVSEMRGICNTLSSSASMVYTGKDGTNISLSFPEEIYGKPYFIRVNSIDKTVAIARDNSTMVACSFFVNASNGLNNTFEASKSPVLQNRKGVVVFG
ncbi:MAG: hypothetical protein ABII22_00825 [Candidatus Micrarchaeota archaeon]